VAAGLISVGAVAWWQYRRRAEKRAVPAAEPRLPTPVQAKEPGTSRALALVAAVTMLSVLAVGLAVVTQAIPRLSRGDSSSPVAVAVEPSPAPPSPAAPAPVIRAVPATSSPAPRTPRWIGTPTSAQPADDNAAPRSSDRRDGGRPGDGDLVADVVHPLATEPAGNDSGATVDEAPSGAPRILEPAPEESQPESVDVPGLEDQPEDAAPENAGLPVATPTPGDEADPRPASTPSPRPRTAGRDEAPAAQAGVAPGTASPTPIATAAPEPARPEIPVGPAYLVEGADMRDASGPNGAAVWTLVAGAEVSIIGPRKNGSYPVSFLSTEGWVSEEALLAGLPPGTTDAPSGVAGFRWPIYGPITSYFGPEHPLGIDLGTKRVIGWPVAASRAGLVTFSGGNACCNYGYYVTIRHGDGFETLYAHFSELWVSAGQYVVQGETLGLSGSTGVSTGPHLHFELRLGGRIVNPLDYLP
jgi:hypothetical protein